MERVRLGVIFFLASEANFFLMLMAAYVYFHSSLGPGPTAKSALDPVRTGAFSLALFASSATVWRASRALKRGQRRRGQAWLGGTVALGLLFILGQALEYRHLLHHGVSIDRNVFGTSFFTLTGFHGLHVLVGLLLLVLLGGLWTGKSAGPALLRATDGVSLYWHFVDAVWVVIFALVYLWSMLDRVGPV